MRGACLGVARVSVCLDAEMVQGCKSDDASEESSEDPEQVMEFPVGRLITTTHIETNRLP